MRHALSVYNNDPVYQDFIDAYRKIVMSNKIEISINLVLPTKDCRGLTALIK